MKPNLSDAAWEAMHAPYDQPTYQAVLDFLEPEDVALEIGAGDLRLARQMATVARKVYAAEINARVLEQAAAWPAPLPTSLTPILADARSLDFPAELTVGVLLMRHCTCFRLYFDRLRISGARRLITNARWRMGVEVIDLWAEPLPFETAEMGWYACRCGAVGFKPGPAERWSAEMDTLVHEVAHCPQCAQSTSEILELL